MIHVSARAAFCATLALAGAVTAADQRQVYLVALVEPAAATFEDRAQLGDAKRAAAFAPTAISVTGARKLDAKSAPVRRYVEFLHQRQDDVLGAAATRLQRPLTPKFRYDLVANGFAIELDADEARQFAGLPGVRSVRAERIHAVDTDAGPQWIGADALWQGTLPGTTLKTRGEGAVVGVIDTGIHAAHPAFQDVASDGFDHSNPRAVRFGICATGSDSRCSDKLIGIHDFVNETCPGQTTTPAGTDCDGHGTHVASTAVGGSYSLSVPAPTTQLVRNFSGVAPRANLIVYKACNVDGCPESATTAALNQALTDGVDVVNYSISSRDEDPWAQLRSGASGPESAFFQLRAGGVVPVVSGGNDGPGAGTLDAVASSPWTLSVAAISSGRRLGTSLANISGHGIAAPFTLFGEGITAGADTAQVVHAKDFGNALCGSGTATNNTTTCTSSASNPFAPGTFAGKIVICNRGEYARIEKGCNVKLAGAVGMVLVNMPNDVDNLVSDPHFLPAVHLDAQEGQQLRDLVEQARLASGQVTASITAVTTSNDGPGDQLADFSSRGPIPTYHGVLKPDLAAPGVGILAADHDSTGVVGLSGTSMASPHVAGAAALLVSGKPDWSATQVISALLTTATPTVLLDDGVTPALGVEAGAGRTRVDLAARGGLSFAVSTTEFRNADPNQGGDPKNLNLPSLHTARCFEQCSFSRTATANQAGTWRVETAITSGATLIADTSEFTLAAGATRALAFALNVNNPALVGRWVEGEVRLIPADANIATTRLPVSVYAYPGNIPARIDIATDTSNGFDDIDFSGLVAIPDLAFETTDLVVGERLSETIAVDSTSSDPYDRVAGTFRRLVGPGAVGLNAEGLLLVNTAGEGDLDLYVGIDVDGDGAPEESEEICKSAGADGNESCRIPTAFTAANQNYWVLVQRFSGSAASAVDIEIAHLPTAAGSGLKFAATGPRVLDRLAPFSARLAWNLPTLAPGARGYGLMRMSSQGSGKDNLGEVLVAVTRSATVTDPAPIIMHGFDDSETITLPAGAAHERIVIDVPANATALHVTTSGSGEVDLYVAKATSPLSPPTFAAAPARGTAAGTSIHAGATEAVDLLAPTLTPGRWYLTPVNSGSSAATFTLTSKLDFGAGAVRPAMQTYRNPNRSGHGMFLSQVANVWALVWYTYLEDGTPTWYYAGGTAPAANDGAWRVPLTRYTWNGTPVYSTVGEVVITFDTATSFTFSWLLNGQYGSEPFSILAPLSCPQSNGAPAQWSGAWYQPGNGGWGFSVTAVSAADAEAVYIFDALGEPRWLLGSIAPAGNPVTIPLSQYSGFCPTCVRTANPTVTPAGTMTRRYTNNNSGSLDINADFAGSVPGTWVRSNSTQAKITPDIACQ